MLRYRGETGQVWVSPRELWFRKGASRYGRAGNPWRSMLETQHSTSESVRLSHVKSEMVQPTVVQGNVLDDASSLRRVKADAKVSYQVVCRTGGSSSYSGCNLVPSETTSKKGQVPLVQRPVQSTQLSHPMSRRPIAEFRPDSAVGQRTEPGGGVLEAVTGHSSQQATDQKIECTHTSDPCS